MKDDVLHGAEEIRAHTGDKTIRRTYHKLETGQLPGFKIGSLWHMRRSTYAALIERLEQEAMAS